MKSDIRNYLKLQTALLNEKAKLEARLSDINRVLGGKVPVAAVPAVTPGGRRSFSAATKAKMAAAQKARWAAKKGTLVLVPTPVSSTTPKEAKRTMSEATKAKMRAAHQARWAKNNGKADTTKAVAPASTPAPKKKRKMSAAGKANIRAAVKARWAKVNAAKAKADSK